MSPTSKELVVSFEKWEFFMAHPPLKKVAEKFIQHLANFFAFRFRQMQINFRRAKAGMSQKNLNRSDVDSLLEESCRKGMPQTVRREVLVKSGFFTSQSKDRSHRLVGNVLLLIFARKKPLAVAMSFPDFTQHREDGINQGNETFGVAFADDTQDFFFGSNGGYRKRTGFGNAKSASIHQADTATRYRFAYRVDQSAAIGIRP